MILTHQQVSAGVRLVTLDLSKGKGNYAYAINT